MINEEVDMQVKYPPGSKAAQRAGCKCPMLDNEYGSGYMGMAGIYVVNGNCPLHGEQPNEQNQEAE